MKLNPIYKRETMVSARSFRLTLVLLIFNGILALVALLNMYSMLIKVRMTAEVQYGSFLDLHLFVAILEFILVVFIMPALTAGSISGERERKTLDILLTTKLTPAQIVLGKLMAALGTMGLLVISSLPVLSLVFVYGGVSLTDIGLLLLSYMTSALFTGSMGICCSAVFKRSTFSTVAAYLLLVLLVIGTYGVNWFAVYLKQVQLEAYLVPAGQTAIPAYSGNLIYLLLLNPTTSFLITIMGMGGQESGIFVSGPWFGGYGMQDKNMIWIGGSVIMQLAMTAVFIGTAVRMLTPGKKIKK